MMTKTMVLAVVVMVMVQVVRQGYHLRPACPTVCSAGMSAMLKCAVSVNHGSQVP